jgi:hypothetical protein
MSERLLGWMDGCSPCLVPICQLSSGRNIGGIEMGLALTQLCISGVCMSIYILIHIHGEMLDHDLVTE